MTPPSPSPSPSPSPFALDLDAPAMQLGVLSYLKTLGDCLERAAAAVPRGDAGRATLIDELTTVQLLAHVLVHRLTEEPSEDTEDAEDAEETEEDAGGVP